MKAVLILIALVGLLLFLVIVALLVLWARGSKTILFPGLGIVISTPLFVTIIAGIEIIVVLCAILSYHALTKSL